MTAKLKSLKGGLALPEYYLDAFKNKRRKKKTLKIILICFLIFIVWFVSAVFIGIFSDDERYGKISDLINENSELRTQIEELKKENEYLKEKYFSN